MNKHKIDIASQVMQKIEHDGLKMRPKYYFRIKKALTLISFAGLVGVTCLAVASLIYAFNNDVFIKYLSVPGGLSLFVRSIPWFGILIFGVCSALLWMSAKLARQYHMVLRPAQAFASVAMFAVVIGLSGGLGVSAKTPAVFSMINYWSNEDPIKTEAVVSQISGDLVTVSVNGQTKYLNLDDIDIELSSGDKILILGEEKNQVINAKYIEILEKKLPEEVQEKPKPKKEEPKEDESVTVQPKTQVTTKPKAEPVSEPTQTDTITIISKTMLGTDKYQINWEANFKLNDGAKIVWSTSSGPVYPGDAYYYDPTPGKSGMGYVKKTLGSGTYYVRVCEYIASQGKCDTYSKQTTVTF